MCAALIKMNNVYTKLVLRFQGQRLLGGDSCSDGRILLELIFEKYSVMRYTSCVCLRIPSNDRILFKPKIRLRPVLV